MKPVYKCDYCSFMGAEEEVREYEQKCIENYDNKGCYTCKHRGKMIFRESDINKIKYECELGKDVPIGYVMKYCDLYERKEKEEYKDLVSGLFGGLFG